MIFFVLVSMAVADTQTEMSTNSTAVVIIFCWGGGGES